LTLIYTNSAEIDFVRSALGRLADRVLERTSCKRTNIISISVNQFTQTVEKSNPTSFITIHFQQKVKQNFKCFYLFHRHEFRGIIVCNALIEDPTACLKMCHASLQNSSRLIQKPALIGVSILCCMWLYCTVKRLGCSMWLLNFFNMMQHRKVKLQPKPQIKNLQRKANMRVKNSRVI